MRVFPRCALAALAALGGCGRHKTAVERGDRTQILHFGNKDEPADLDPHINNADSTGTLLSSLFDGLVGVASDGRTILPAMADHWESSPDGLVYTFHIRENARWSNGQPMTSRDFLDGFLRILDPKLGCEMAGYAFPIRGARDFVERRSADPDSVGLKAPDPRTLVVSLDFPAPWLLGVLSNYPFYPVYMPSLEAAGGRHQRGGAWERPGILASNGPFTLADWRPNAYVRVIRNPAYWDASHVRLSEIWFYPTDDVNTEERAFRSGQLHVTARIPKSKVEVYAGEHPGELHVVTSLRTNYLTCNVHRPPFDDARIRRAFALAIDRDRLVRAAVGRLGAPAYALIHPGAGGFTMPEVFRFDPAEARALLAAAGHPGGAGLPPVEFTLNGTTGIALDVAAVLQRMWADALGIHVSIVPEEFKVYLSTLRERQFQLLLDGWVSIDDPRDMAEIGLADDPNNDAGVDDPLYNQLFSASDRAPNRQARRRAFEAMEARNEKEAYYIPLYYGNHGFLVDPHVRGWKDNLVGRIDWRDLYLQP